LPDPNCVARERETHDSISRCSEKRKRRKQERDERAGFPSIRRMNLKYVTRILKKKRSHRGEILLKNNRNCQSRGPVSLRKRGTHGERIKKDKAIWKKSQ